MKLTRSSLKNPAVVAVVAAVLLLMGVVTLFRLPVQLLPNVEKSFITVFTQWRSAAPSEVESEITDQLEEVLLGIPGLEEMTSTSAAGFSFIGLRFGIEANQTQNLIEVISRMNRLRPLPADADPPQVFLGDFGDDSQALMWFFIQMLPGEERNPVALYDYFENVIVPQIEQIPGVTGSNLYSSWGTGQELQIIIDPYKVAALGIDLTEVALRASRSSDISGGFLDVGRRQFALRFKGKFEVDTLPNLVVAFRNGLPIYLSEVATINVGPGRPSGVIYQNGNMAFAFKLLKDKNTNVLKTLKAVKAKANELNETVLKNKGLFMARSYDPSVFINRAINLLSGNLVLGLLFAVGILWWFLREKKAVAIITLAVPISLMTTIVVLGLLGRSINVITLAGLAFATGMIMDAAIVVMENIVRHREKKVEKEEASDKGATQVWGALLASTMTTVVIFLPVMFLEDVEGQLFMDLALTMAISVSVSLITAMTILPTISAKWLTKIPNVDVHNQYWEGITNKILSLTNTRKKQIGWIAGLMSASIALTIFLMPSMDYLPTLKDDRVDAFFLAPPGVTTKALDEELAKPIMERLSPYMSGEKEPKLENYYFASFGSAFVFMGVRAEDENQVGELERLMREEITVDFPDTYAFVQRANLFGGFSSSGSILVHMQSADQEALKEAAIAGMEIMRQKFPGANVNANPNPFSSSPEIQLQPNDRAITEVGWTRRSLGSVVQILGDGLWLGEHFDGENRLDIILKSQTSPDPETIVSIPVATPRAGVVTLGNLVEFKRVAGPQQIQRVNGRRTTTLVINPPEGLALEEVLEVLQEEVEPELIAMLPPDANIAYGGSANDLGRAVNTLLNNFLLAFFLLFMIMAALFRSLKDSFLVLISVPLATVGGVAALKILNLISFQAMDLLAMIGFVILLGLVVNNAILLVVQTRRSQARGLDLKNAIKRALRLRLRPIFMSTLTSIFGMMPLLLFPGEGSVIYRGMAAVIVGGMSVSTIFTLLLLPSLLQIAGASHHDTEFSFWKMKNWRKSAPAE